MIAHRPGGSGPPTGAGLPRHDQLPDRCFDCVRSASPAAPAPTEPTRAALRWRSIAWALLAGTVALAVGTLLALPPVPALQGVVTSTTPAWPRLLQSALRAGGCGGFYGLLAFHLHRVDPDDSHLQAGLVGAVCGLHSLGLPLPLPAASHLPAQLLSALPPLLLELVAAWLPVIAAALLLQWLPRRLPALRP